MARPARRPGNLPAEAASFVGRRRELAEVRSKLAEARLVSLVGPGGVGKTRLAIRAATDLGRGFRDGGWLVELAEVGDSALVSHAVTAALDLRDQAAAGPLALLRDYLRDKELLLVADNCEHLLGAAGQVVTDILKAAPGVRVIVTSREPLSVPGEHVIPVPPLALPALDAAEPLDRLRQNETVRLFTERAAAASGTFELTGANRAAVVDLCRRLDGLPLAIELAAVRTRVLSAEQILDRLADRFGLLTGDSRAALPRHQTLRTTIEWSHDLLTDAERAVLRRCCAFAGRFTLDDVEAVCASGDVPAAQGLDVLSSLVGKSLVTKEDARGVACYRLHETMREFARLKLAEAGEQESTELRCAEYYRLRCARSALEGRYRLVEWLEWADLAGDRAAARRLLEEADATAAGLAYPAGRLAVLQAKSLDGFFAADLGAVAAAAGPGARLARETGDLYVLEIMLLNLGSAALQVGDLDESKPLLAEALRIARQIDDRVAQFYLLGALGCHAARSGEPRLAARLIGAADTAQTGAGANVMPFMASAVTEARQSAATALGPARFEAEFEAGRGLGRDTALGLALGQPAPARRAPARPDPGPLGKREADVARLVADGLTNKQIGARLFISERTVDSHVRSILNKLGFSSRAQVAVWAAEEGH